MSTEQQIQNFRGTWEKLRAEIGKVMVGHTDIVDTVDATGEKSRPSTLWRVVSVTVHVPSLASQRPQDGNTLCVQQVEVAVLPDVSLVPEFAAAAEQILSESKM